MTVHDILREIEVNGEIHKEELCSDNIIRYEVGTNGHMYGNSGRGTFTYVSLRDVACTDWNIIVERGEWGDLKGFKLYAEGDAELDLLADAFGRISLFLREQSKALRRAHTNGTRPVLKPEDNEYWEKFFGKVGRGTMEEIEGLIAQGKALREAQESLREKEKELKARDAEVREHIKNHPLKG